MVTKEYDMRVSVGPVKTDRSVKASEIDFVVAWCDSADPVFAARMAETLARVDSSKMERCAATVNRCQAHDELRYLLRCVESHLPWVRRVHLVIADFQTLPDWLDAGHARLNVVRHSAIMPTACLPTFCSNVIELHLHRIPGLAERYLYANDDMMTLMPLSPGYFFHPRDGYPYARFSIPYSDLSQTSDWCARLQDADRLIEDRFGRLGEFKKACGLTPHHGIDAYVRSDVLAFAELYADEIARGAAYPFRRCGQIQRKAVSNYALAIGHAHFKQVRRRFCDRLSRTFLRPLLGTWNSTVYLRPDMDMEAEIRRCGRPGLVCFNDDGVQDAGVYVGLQAFMRKLYPKPSSFEKK